MAFTKKLLHFTFGLGQSAITILTASGTSVGFTHNGEKKPRRNGGG